MPFHLTVKNKKGLIGENQAAIFLQKKGYKILHKNFRIRNGEIDIICLDPDRKILVFFEVKTRFSNQYGTPFEAITSWKLNSLIRTAEFYKSAYPRLPESMRIDAISVMLDGENQVASIEHIENIT